MKLQVRNTRASIRRPPRLPRKTWSYVQPIIAELRHSQRQIGRSRFYSYLVAVYRTHREWKKLGISKRLTRQLTTSFNITRRKGKGSVRILIEATFPALDPKEKSRWSRALEFAASTKTTPEDLSKLFKKHSGIAGCARLAAKHEPKKDTYRNDWL